MEARDVIQVTPENWSDVAHMINWRQPETVDRSGNRIMKDMNGTTAFCIPFDMWYEAKAYNRVWRKFSSSVGN